MVEHFYINGGFILVLYVFMGAYLEWWPFTLQQMFGWANWKGWIYPQEWNKEEK